MKDVVRPGFSLIKVYTLQALITRFAYPDIISTPIADFRFQSSATESLVSPRCILRVNQLTYSSKDATSLGHSLKSVARI